MIRHSTDTIDHGWPSMKVAALVCSLSFSLNPFLAAQPGKPFKTIDLNKAKTAGSMRRIKLQDEFSRVMWLDEQHLLASSFSARCSSASPPRRATAAVVFDITVSVEATDCRSGVNRFSKGPRKTIAALGSGEIELLDVQLHRQQTIECPNSYKACGITLGPNATVDSDFTVCSTVDQHQRVCDFYSGWPAVPLRRTKSQPENPYSHLVNSGPHSAWQIAPGEMWFFNNGRLTASDASKVLSPVNSEDFDGPAYVSAALSPSGKMVAILKGGKVRLYEAD